FRFLVLVFPLNQRAAAKPTLDGHVLDTVIHVLKRQLRLPLRTMPLLRFTLARQSLVVVGATFTARTKQGLKRLCVLALDLCESERQLLSFAFVFTPQLFIRRLELGFQPFALFDLRL